MQIVIDIPEEIYNSACTANNIWDMRMAGFVCSAISNGTLLPKGHGRLIDADNLPLNAIDDANYGSNYIRIAQTIIEADKAESEE